MLTNLLPGIRDLRTPLATGYLWLLALWLWIPSHFKHAPPTSGVPGDITYLAHYASRVGVAIAVSFAAYVVGVLSQHLNPPLAQLGTACVNFATLISVTVVPKVKPLDSWRKSYIGPLRAELTRKLPLREGSARKAYIAFKHLPGGRSTKV
jgi:hypothetical protein